jgi:GrpB-like predicted nucleotidyltransferase (UPF0157 family)
MQIAAEYGELKRQLAAHHRFDREVYTSSKNPFITRITQLAMRLAG